MRPLRVAALVAIVIVGLGLAPAFSAGPGAAPASPAGARQAAKDLTLLHAWLEGSFSSRTQASRDSSYRDLRLHVAAIWPAMSAAHWFYVEQAAAGREKTPERQRVYRLSLRDDGRYEIAVFTLPVPVRFVGAWSAPIEQRLAQVTPDSLLPSEGCTVWLRKQRDQFAGGTEGKGCSGERGGATYAMTELQVRPDRLILLERGWDASGKPVSGAKQDGIEFVRVVP